MPRTEFYPYLELIRSSEVDVFAPAPGASPTVVAALKRAQTGQSDMQTAYSLAISNLIQQVQYTKKEVLHAHALLARMQDKHKREERSAFVLLLAAVAVLSLILVKTDALQDLKDYAQEVTPRWKRVDLEWLGNPPSYKNAAHSFGPAAPKPEPLLFEPLPPVAESYSPIAPIEAQSDQQARSLDTPSTQLNVRQVNKQWSFSRLFWTTSK